MKLCKCKGSCTKTVREVIIWVGIVAAAYFMIKGFTMPCNHVKNTSLQFPSNYTPLLLIVLIVCAIFSGAIHLVQGDIARKDKKQNLNHQ